MQSEVQPWRLTIYSPLGVRRGWIAAPAQLSATLRANAVSIVTVTVPTSHPHVSHLLEPGARVVVEHDVAWDAPETGPDWRHVLSGPVRSRQGHGPQASATVTVTVADDYRLLSRVLAWPVPTAPIDAQTSTHDVLTGPAETVAKTLVQRNAVDRLGLPVTVEPTQGRGPTITVAARMTSLADVIGTALTDAGLTMHVKQVINGGALHLAVSVQQRRTHTRPLTEESGAVRAWQYALSEPEATRVIVGGPGEGVERTFLQVIDIAREVEHADLIEAFRDATDATTVSLLAARGAQTLAETAPTSGLSLELADTPGLRPLRDIAVGDRVTVDVGGQRITDTLTEIRVKWDASSGTTTTPVVGGWSGSPQRALTNIVGRLARTVARQQRR